MGIELDLMSTSGSGFIELLCEGRTIPGFDQN